ncbi:acyl-CoA carboxylase subunit beta [Flexivirga meconopsidis]|uniref:acyl-CoA carboxylase subunit beta n=1 Tax=Flexivirga meconopsidis TaxID=2977121 RepID=UPI0022404F35|nr:acyl-CoA carboxylase subunit beta [Flexivirga meconopsidis]
MSQLQTADDEQPTRPALRVIPPSPPDAAPTSPTMQHGIIRLRRMRDEVRSTTDRASEVQRGRGKLTARERVEHFFDSGTFHEIEGFRRHRATDFGMADRRPHSDGVITGWGMVHGRRVFAYASDFRIFGGSLGEAHAQKVHKLMDLALQAGAPIVSINDGAGARIQEGVSALAGYGGIFRRTVAASGVVPQISVMVGPCAGGAAYAPALTDFVFAVRQTSQMFVTGPDVVTAVTGESMTAEQLGGADIHSAASGVVSFVYDDERECLDDVRFLLSLLPANNHTPPPEVLPEDPAVQVDLAELVPAEPQKSYDVLQVIETLVDDSEFIEVHETWAPNIVCVFARIDGQTVGIVANQPTRLAGAMDISSSEKAARFVTQCDSFGIPIITLVDVPGFLPGTDQERGGIIRHGAKLIYAYCNAQVPRIQVIMRKAYGGAYIVMDSRSIGADLSFAWPTNEIAVMGADAAANVIFRKEIAGSDEPEATRARRVQEYSEQLMHSFYAAERGLVDDVIEPDETRAALIEGLAMLRSRGEAAQRRHGNPPL